MCTVLQFPDERAKGRKRRRDSAWSMGELALGSIECPKPTNVVRMASIKAAEHSHGHLGLLLAGTILKCLPPETQDYVIGQLNCMESHFRDTRATALLEWLDSGRS